MKQDTFGQATDYTEPPRHLDQIIYDLRKRRYDQNISQSALARKIGVGVDTLKKWEQGVLSPSLFNLQAWAKSLGHTITLG